MRVFVTGATGFVGTAVVKELSGAGHRVLGLARSDAAAHALAALGAEAHRGSLDDRESLRRGVAAADGVIHCAFIHDFADYLAAAETDRLAIETLGDALAGSGRPFVVTSGTALMAPGRTAFEHDAPDPASAAAARIASERAALAAASRGVRVSVLRLPPSVHGAGDHGFVPGLIGVAREKQVSAYVGEGRNVWPAVHLLDAARAYRLALEKASAGAVFHAVADEGVALRAIAEVIARRLGLLVVARPVEEAAEHFGWLSRFVAIDNPASGAATQERLDWRPAHPGLLADLEQGRYFES